MKSFQALTLALVVATASGAAFVPAPAATKQVTQTTALSFGFLKDLGIEKPGWLPDFGGSKEEDKPAEEPAAEDAAEEAPADAAEE
jgi:hypothetical protein